MKKILLPQRRGLGLGGKSNREYPHYSILAEASVSFTWLGLTNSHMRTLDILESIVFATGLTIM